MIVQAICGRGGIGKTELAIQFARRYAHKYSHVLFVGASDHAWSAETELALLRRLVRALPLPEPPPDAAADALRTGAHGWLLANEGWLLIVDNADDVHALQVGDADKPEGAVRRCLLPRSPVTNLVRNGGHVLFTSRIGADEFQSLVGLSSPLTLRTLPQARVNAHTPHHTAIVASRRHVCGRRRRRCCWCGTRRGSSPQSGATRA